MNRLEVFNEYRSLLFAIAYRMLSSVTDAEDVVQEAWLRWQATETTVQTPKAYLSKLITRLCIDHLRSARVQREQYIGLWLPEPILTDDGMNQIEIADSLSFAFLMLLECLSPTERAIFLLREVFDYDYAEIASIVNKSVPNCRQIVRRARQHLTLRRPTTSTEVQSQEQLIEQFLVSWNRGDVYSLIALMAEDISFWGDGGGQMGAVRQPLHGALKVARFLVAIRRSSLLPILTPQQMPINGQLGLVNYVNEKLHSVFTFDVQGNVIQSIFAIVNPVKLQQFRTLELVLPIMPRSPQK